MCSSDLGALAALIAGTPAARGQDGPAPPRPAASGPVGSRSVEEVAQAVRQRKDVLYAAYKQALKRDPGIKGKVVVEFLVEPSGRVSEISFPSSEIADADFLEAVRSVFLQARFSEQPVARMTVSYPLVFLPQ